MTRTIRIASLLRWMIVAAHTAFVLSMCLCPARGTIYHSERIIAQYLGAFLMLIDLPVTILSFAVWALTQSPSAYLAGQIITTIVFVVLGGLQWYWLAGLLARRTFGCQKTLPLASKRFGIVMALAFILVGGCGTLPWTAHLERLLYPRKFGPYSLPPVAFSGDSRDLRQSVIVPTLDTPMPKGKNVVWCGTLQLAWNRLGKDVLHKQPQVQGAEEVVSRLNQAQLREDDLPADSYLATAGFAKDGVVEKIKAEMKHKFHKDVAIDAMEPNDILAYAYLEASAAFTIPFFENRGAFSFIDSDGVARQVSSFGIEERHEYAYEALREQIEVLYSLRNKGSHEGLDEFVLDLCRDSSPNQIVVACVPPKATLLETLADVEKKTRDFPQQPYAEYARRFGVRDVLLVPNLNWEIAHHFAELERSDKQLVNTGFSSYHIAKAMQTIRFKLDRSGAELASEAQMPCKPMATHFVFNRPFLIVVKKRGAERPFFVMWVDNAELLCRQ